MNVYSTWWLYRRGTSREIRQRKTELNETIRAEREPCVCVCVSFNQSQVVCSVQHPFGREPKNEKGRKKFTSTNLTWNQARSQSKINSMFFIRFSSLISVKLQCRTQTWGMRITKAITTNELHSVQLLLIYISSMLVIRSS